MSDKADYTELYLPDGDLDETSRGFAQQIRAFADDKLAPHAREIDETCTFRREMVDDLGRAGVLGGPLPTDVGGGDWDSGNGEEGGDLEGPVEPDDGDAPEL